MNPQNALLHYDQAGLDLTEHSEADGGPKLKSFWDEYGKCWTAGWGHTQGVGPDTVCTVAQAEAWLEHDVTWAVWTVKSQVMVPLSQDEFDALVDFCFNVGAGNFQRSTLLEKLNAKDYVGSLAEFQRWDMSGGVVLPGLISRRAAEAALFKLGMQQTNPNPNV